MGLAHIFSGSRRSECVISHGNTHESLVVYRQSFTVYRPLGDKIPFDTRNHVESGAHHVAVCVYCSEHGDGGHSRSSWTRVRAHLSSDAAMALAAGTTACAHVDAVADEKFKAVIREATTNAAQKASLKRARGNADDPAPPPRAVGAAGAQESRDRHRVLARGRGLRWNDSEFTRLGTSFPLLRLRFLFFNVAVGYRESPLLCVCVRINEQRRCLIRGSLEFYLFYFFNIADRGRCRRKGRELLFRQRRLVLAR